MAPVATRQIEASDLPWPHQKVAEQLEAASPATLVWMGFQRVGRGPTDALTARTKLTHCRFVRSEKRSGGHFPPVCWSNRISQFASGVKVGCPEVIELMTSTRLQFGG
jgi:hypothetical protein